jgi:flavin reductase (DIM6/NTAB) family NADH-FMN oxidoreductase RutF
MLFDFSTTSPQLFGKILSATVVPRPIAWVVTRDDAGCVNAAPFSFFNVVSSHPPVICLGIHNEGEGPKHTAANIESRGEFVVNLVPFALAREMNITAAEFGDGIDELQVAGLATTPSLKVAPPLITGSPVGFECRLTHLIKLNAEQWVVLAEVLAVHIHDSAVISEERGHIDTQSLDLIGRMQGGGWYTRTSDVFDMPRVGPND